VLKGVKYYKVLDVKYNRPARWCKISQNLKMTNQCNNLCDWALNLYNNQLCHLSFDTCFSRCKIPFDPTETEHVWAIEKLFYRKYRNLQSRLEKSEMFH